MDKVQDGFASFTDSHRPLNLTLDRKAFATLSFVQDRIVIRAVRGAKIFDVRGDDDSLSFELGFDASEAASDQPDSAPAQKGKGPLATLAKRLKGH